MCPRSGREREADRAGRSTAPAPGADPEVGRRSNAPRSIVQVGVAVVLVAGLLHVVDLEEVARLIASASVPLLIAAAVTSFGDRLFMIGKWYPLLTVQQTNVSPMAAGRAYFAAGFAAIFLPASVGGDVLRAVALGRAQGKVVEVGASIIIERALGLLGVALMCMLAGVVAFRAGIRLDFVLPWAMTAAVVAGGALAAPVLVDEQSRIGRWLARRDRLPAIGLVRRFADAYALYRGRTRLVTAVAALSTIEQFMPIIVLWLVSRALSASIEFHMLLVAVPLTMFVARMPIAAWGLGIMEGALTILLGLFGVPPAQALAVSLCGRVVDIVAILPGAVLWRDLIRSPEGRRPAVHERSGERPA